MSYCRFSNSDVFMYPHDAGFIECCACSLAPLEPTSMSGLAAALGMNKEDSPELFEDFEMNGTLQFDTRSDALAHLQAHRDAGHKVSELAFERLNKELREEGERVLPLDDDAEDLIDLGLGRNGNGHHDDEITEE